MQGVRANQLVGYGLVIGLNGTGDSLRNAPFTEQSLQSMLDRMGVNVRNSKARTRNVAAVMVTAELPAFIGKGARIDVTVSSLGDATSLQGGSLILTPLQGADAQIYAVAQGPLAVTGFAQTGKAETVTQGVPTTGRMPNGAHGGARCARQARRRDGDRIRAAQSGFQHRRQYRRCDQPLYAAALRHQSCEGKRSAHRGDGAAVLSLGGPLHCRGRRAAGARGCAGQSRDRRAHRHDRDRQGRADLDRRGGARQLDRARHGERQGLPAQPVRARRDRGDARYADRRRREGRQSGDYSRHQPAEARRRV